MGRNVTPYAPGGQWKFFVIFFFCGLGERSYLYNPYLLATLFRGVDSMALNAGINQW